MIYLVPLFLYISQQILNKTLDKIIKILKSIYPIKGVDVF